MSDSENENYFSDSDEEQVNVEEETYTPEDGYESSDNELDEETRRIIYNHARLSNPTSVFLQPNSVPKKSSKKQKKKREPKSHGKSLQDFMDELEKQKEASKPKKWTSKRLSDKKDKLGLPKEKFTRRKFNPRLPPPTHLTFKKKDTVVKVEFNEESFPSLGDYDISSNKSANVNV